jgi:hypothetical protein
MTDKTDREIMYQAMVALDSKHDMTKAEWRYLQYHAFNDLRERLAQPDPRNQCGETCERAKLCAVCLAEMGAQPEREWQALTDREVGALTVFDGLHHVEVPVLAKFVWAVEAKLKEKNT